MKPQNSTIRHLWSTSTIFNSHQFISHSLSLNFWLWFCWRCHTKAQTDNDTKRRRQKLLTMLSTNRTYQIRNDENGGEKKPEMKNAILNKISIILEFVQYHYVAIFLSLTICAFALSVSLSLVIPKLWHCFFDPIQFIVRVPSFIGTQFIFSLSSSFYFAIEVDTDLLLLLILSKEAISTFSSTNTFKLLLASDR